MSATPSDLTDTELVTSARRGDPLRAMDRDLSDEVRFQLTHVVGGCDVAIWEFAMINPPDDPDHCPPVGVWVQQLKDGRVERMRILHSREPGPVLR